MHKNKKGTGVNPFCTVNNAGESCENTIEAGSLSCYDLEVVGAYIDWHHPKGDTYNGLEMGKPFNSYGCVLKLCFSNSFYLCKISYLELMRNEILYYIIFI